MRTKLRPGEKLLLETKVHWLTVAIPFLILLLALILFGLAMIMPKEETTAIRLLRWVTGMISAVAALWFIYCEWFRRCNIWAVTTLRVIDEEGIFSHSSKESPLEKINNTSYYQSLLGRMFNYGDIEIQTAAEQGATIYHMVHRPRLLKDTIARACEDHRLKMARVEGGKAEEGFEGEPTRECPFCAERVKSRAKICRYCGKELPPLQP